jgi:hypothetical protein
MINKNRIFSCIASLLAASGITMLTIALEVERYILFGLGIAFIYLAGYIDISRINKQF